MIFSISHGATSNFYIIGNMEHNITVQHSQYLNIAYMWKCGKQMYKSQNISNNDKMTSQTFSHIWKTSEICIIGGWPINFKKKKQNHF